MVIYREVSFRDMFDILVDSAKTTGGIMLIVASASLFSFVCTKFGIADAASNLLGSIELKIVGSTEANSLEGKISNESPVGKALIGAHTGDVVEVEMPAGIMKYKVLEIQRNV